jgi:hypothetical protein
MRASVLVEKEKGESLSKNFMEEMEVMDDTENVVIVELSTEIQNLDRK